ncbi:ATP-grasp domain-containing protein [Clostridium chromiireducens]|uniref:Carbamoyl phosphate synthase-like protein n=1 Tax=Clostridium chromiireducens TaxID=225345 RepID=A0A1V4IHP7_9CLOT|nr:ATP-grasp domain-containing protein [Clostridium chromiireducens]OPJ59531.1 carbamoyl phosphate synthase-like protein [Clostridium chromiireducens]
MKSILITSIGSSTAVNFIKLLKRRYEIIGCDINEYGYTAGSMMVDEYYKVSLSSDEKYIEEIVDIIKRENVKVIIPIHDEEIYQISKHKNQIEKAGVKVLIPEVEYIELFRDKYLASKAVQKIGVKIPKIFEGEIPINKQKLIKREKVSVGSKGIEILDSWKENIIIDPKKEFLQEYIEGDEYTVDIMKYGDEEILIIPRLRMEIKSGVATKVKIEKDEALISVCKKILEEYPLMGFSNIQFIKDKNDNIYFIELNPRFGGMSISSVLASDNYVELYVEKIIEDENSIKRVKEINIKWNSIVTRYFEEKIFYES